MKNLFDAEMFGRWVRSELTRRIMSLRELEREIGVDHAIIHRVTQDKAPNVENYLRLLKWLKQ